MVRINEEFREILIKIIIPAFIIISMMLIVKRRVEGKLSTFTIVSSYALGIGFCYLCRGLIFKYFPGEASVVPVAALAISSEHIIKFILYKLNWDALGNWFLNLLKSMIERKIGNK